MTARITIDIGELKAEAKHLLLAIERDRITPKPVQRIGEIIGSLRNYKMAVVKANVPRRVDLKPLNSRRTTTLLRQHRDEHLGNADPATGVTPLRRWLNKLDCAFVLAGQLYWRLNDTDWELSVWRPLSEWVECGYGMLYGQSQNAEWPWPIEAGVLATWESEEQELEYRFFARMSSFIPKDDSPVLDEKEPFTIRWRECACYLGDTDGFKIMQLLIKTKNRMVSRLNLGLAIGNDDFSDDALRQAVARLKKKLRIAGLGELAERIKTVENGKFIVLDRATQPQFGTD